MKRYLETLWIYGISRKKQEIFEALLEKDGIPVKPGLYELLEYLEAQKIPAALASASRMEYTERNLEKTGIRRYFCHLVTGDMVSHAKPNPEIFWKAAELLGGKAGGLSGFWRTA